MISKINDSLATNTKISQLSDMILELEGLSDSGKFDENEITSLYSDLGLNRKFIRNRSLGNSLVLYTDWTHLYSESGYSIWKITPGTYTYNANNTLYLDNKVLVNRGLANSETATTFDKVFLYNGDSGSGYVDNTTEAGTEVGTQFDLMNSINDYIYFGSASTFSGIKLEFHTRGSNYTLKVEYYNGGWVTLTANTNYLTDNTSNFESDGLVEWTVPADWTTTTVNSQSKYWIRISTTTTPVTVAKTYYAIPGTSVVGLLALSSSEILNEDWAWCSYQSSIYVTIRNTGQTAYEGNYYITSSSSSTNKQNYFIHNHVYSMDYQDSTYVAGTLKIDTDTLYVDATNHRVGINTLVPAYDLDISGNLRATNILGTRVSIGTTTVSPRLYVYESTTGNEVVRVASPTDSSGSTSEVNFSFYQNSIITTNNNYGDLHIITLDDNSTYLIQANVVARRTGGASGTAGDGAGYVLTGCFRRVSAGVATIIGSVDTDVTCESQSNFDANLAVTGNTVKLQVRGATNNNLLWHCTLFVQKVSA